MNIFISYRRGDSGLNAGWLHHHLSNKFKDKASFFIDVGSIPLGEDFEKEIRRSVSQCELLIAVIGPQWLDIRDKHGRRRLDNPDDYPRIEIAAALDRNIRVIPLFTDGALPPAADQLPNVIRLLATRTGIDVRTSSFLNDIVPLEQELQKLIDSTARRDDARPRPAEKSSPQPAPAVSASSYESPLLLIMGEWYDRGENKYFIVYKSPEGRSPSNLRVYQTMKSRPDEQIEVAGLLEGDIVSFNCWLPGSGGSFDGRLVRSPGLPDTLVGEYRTNQGRWDVTLHRSSAPP
jgi:hypothetical protein